MCPFCFSLLLSLTAQLTALSAPTKHFPEEVAEKLSWGECPDILKVDARWADCSVTCPLHSVWIPCILLASAQATSLNSQKSASGVLANKEASKAHFSFFLRKSYCTGPTPTPTPSQGSLPVQIERERSQNGTHSSLGPERLSPHLVHCKKREKLCQ
uniref:Secreted protein n=1 Tax=Colobus angolensis palliatus TaxID=336983 RepID=A0A2K5HQE8_COLAP